MVYLDTHIVALLKRHEFKSLSAAARRLVEREPDIRISPMVVLELSLLYEIGRFVIKPSVVLKDLAAEIGLTICDHPFGAVAMEASGQTWTRDPFDRLIVAQAKVANAKLITRDQTMLRHYSLATD